MKNRIPVVLFRPAVRIVFTTHGDSDIFGETVAEADGEPLRLVGSSCEELERWLFLGHLYQEPCAHSTI
jgi:hypothetical protein